MSACSPTPPPPLPGANEHHRPAFHRPALTSITGFAQPCGPRTEPAVRVADLTISPWPASLRAGISQAQSPPIAMPVSHFKNIGRQMRSFRHTSGPDIPLSPFAYRPPSCRARRPFPTLAEPYRPQGAERKPKRESHSHIGHNTVRLRQGCPSGGALPHPCIFR